jgi:hypothetical protein
MGSKATKSKSQTIPGQAYRMKDLIAKLQGGEGISQALHRDGEYTMDQMANDANTVDIAQAMDKYNRLQAEIDALEKGKKAEKKAKELEALKASLRAEIEAERNDDSNDDSGAQQ